MLRSIAFDYSYTKPWTEGFQSMFYFAKIIFIFIGLVLLLDFLHLRVLNCVS